MRREMYEKILARLKERVPEIEHYDLWNENVDYVEQETAWSRPAAFVEFGAIGWTALTGRPAYKGTGKVLVHVVTDWDPEDAPGAGLQLSDKVAKALAGLSGDYFQALEMSATYTNHNHEYLVDNVEEFSVRCVRSVD